LPDVHCPAEVHWLPLATVPHESLTHGAETHWLLVAQVVAHAVPPAAQVKGAQVTPAGALQLPAPSQTEPVTAVFVAVLQEPPAQLVPLTHSSQLPLPSHLPSSWQVEAADAAHAVCVAGGAVP
jgi:hypothetical protein